MCEDKKLFPREEILDGKYFNTHQDWSIPIPGFFIIASKRKIFSIDEFTEEEYQEFMTSLRNIRKGMREVLNIEEVYLFQNEDSEHGFHLWIFPRYKWMDSIGRKIQSVRPIMEYAREKRNTKEVEKKVKESVTKMKKYLNQV